MTLLADEPLTSADLPGGSPPRHLSWVVSAGMALSLVSGTSSFVAMPLVRYVDAAGATTGTGGFLAPHPPAEPSTAEAIGRLRDRSGLSWDQLAGMFGVSRRSVHKWAGGGALNAGHTARLRHLTQLVGGLGPTPAAVRAQLFMPDRNGATLYQQLVRQALPTSDRPEGFGIDELVGSRRDGDVTVLGDLIDAEPIDWPGQHE
jgi:transcriptional regulator with XRE-family HTH domain